MQLFPVSVTYWSSQEFRHLWSLDFRLAGPSSAAHCILWSLSKHPPVVFSGNLLSILFKQLSFFKCFFQFPLQNCEAMPWLLLLLLHPPAPSDSRLNDCCASTFFKHSLPGESSPVSPWIVWRKIWIVFMLRLGWTSIEAWTVTSCPFSL